MNRLLMSLITLIILVTASSSVILAQDANTISEENYIIIYDQGHGQYFTTELMQTALTSLNSSFDIEGTTDVTVQLVVHDTEFNSTNLQGADLVIISNPGFVDGELVEIDTNSNIERNALATMIDINAGVLYMSNPLSNNPNITGHAEPLNDLIIPKFRADPEIGTEPTAQDDPDNVTLILDEINNSGNNSHVYIPIENINSETITLEPNNLTSSGNSRLLYYGGHISATEALTGPINGNTSQFAYYVDQSYTINDYQDGPLWLHGEDFGETKGRAMVLGSTIMFSDYAYDDNTNWIDQEQNLAFFQNIVGWLLDITPYPEDVPIVTQRTRFFIQTNILAAVILGAGILFGVFGVFVYRGRLSFSQFFDFFAEAKGTEQKKTSKDKSDKKSKRQHRKRRKRT